MIAPTFRLRRKQSLRCERHDGDGHPLRQGLTTFALGNKNRKDLTLRHDVKECANPA
ncbi:hypothetical protein CONPUDRAFT_83330 [Coniophora puteana RWD-64-598 SS2]|uniref:Uncharacterized protein n=1 Tax=Coniophora puteana (strain RWD-64-598) TaxID=741705 RepID=A0A5M3MIY8_CONPW|nr:uncharacterized protein CONPUDRAFT_83330 [Coniophora puteana RWD-64-598 SS2]EIW78947.1 hypothetical protein CONPUDRAFT_83330 [Coniophora puteana RWD-64-598 SS2]